MATPTYGQYSFYMPTPPKKKRPQWEIALEARSQGMMDQWGDYVNAPGSVAPPPSSAPAATPPPGLPGSIRLPGYDPDYAAILAADPTLLSAGGDLLEAEGALGDARRSAIRRAIIAAGLAPQQALADIDEATRQAALANRFSTMAELERSRGRSQADLGAGLGARGLTFSGAQQGGSERIQEGFERGTQQLTTSLLDAIAGYESDYTKNLAQVRLQYNQLKEQAALRVLQDPRYQPIGETDAVLDPASGLYMTPDGRWYKRNPDGTTTRVSAPAGGGQAPAATPPPATTAPPTTITQFPASRPAQNLRDPLTAYAI